MKLCRFRLGDDPKPRSGFVHEELVYETDGLHPIGTYRLSEVSLLAPLSHAFSFRDFDAFLAKTSEFLSGEEKFEEPFFQFQYAGMLLGHQAPLRKPPDTEELDFEFEVAVVIGKPGMDIPVSEASDYILGFTILNDWTARDKEREERARGWGIGKSKDFGTSVGPYLVTPDALESRRIRTERGDVYDLPMEAQVNGQLVAKGNLKEMRWTFAELVSHASRYSWLWEGDLIGSGMMPGGCLAGRGQGFLHSGDEVALRVWGLGELVNQVV